MFGDLIRAHRRRCGVTQEQLAERAGISARHLRDLEAGRTARPRMYTVQLLADALLLDEFQRVELTRAADRSPADDDAAVVA